jgi:hypothetical protein
MNGLARLPAAQGVAAMQAIDAAAISVPFVSALFGTAAACLALAAWPRPGAPYLLAGGAQYLPVSRRGDPADGAVPHAAQRRPGDRPADGRALVGATTIALRGTPDKEGV